MIHESCTNIGQRWLDSDKVATVKPSTAAAYQKAASTFCDFLEERGWYPQDILEWDDFAVEFSYEEYMTVSKMRNLYAALEFVFPRIKGQLKCLKCRIEILEFLHPPRHTVPACLELCVLLAAQMSSMGRARMGLGVLVQYALGLRPGELTSLVPSDV